MYSLSVWQIHGIYTLIITISSIWHSVGIRLFFIWPCQSSLGISLCPSGPEWCHQEWMWSRYHTGLSVPCQMQLCHPWHHLNLLKFNGSCTSGLNHLALRRVFACKNDFGGDEMDTLISTKYAFCINYFLWLGKCCVIALQFVCFFHIVDFSISVCLFFPLVFHNFPWAKTGLWYEFILQLR